MCHQDAFSGPNGAAIAAQRYIGVPFAHKGRDRDGMDCYGLFLAMMRDMGAPVPDFEYIADWEKSGGNVIMENYWKHGEEIQKEDLVPGDAILFKNSPVINHIAVYLGGGKFVHATKAGVSICTLDRQPYNRTAAMFCRLKRQESITP